MVNRVLDGRTRAAILSGPGRGAIALIRVWGTEAVQTVDRAFRPNRSVGFSTTPPGLPRVGRIGLGLGDEVVAVIEVGPNPEVSVQCHGGSAATALVFNAILAQGAVRARPEAWIKRSAQSRIESEARLSIGRASTTRVAEILLDQIDGTLERALAETVDHPEMSRLLMDRFEVGKRLIPGWQVVLAGRPNVGKSRLLNALAGFDRAIVDPTPGTTRDVVSVRTAFDGWPVELADTAGLRRSDDPIESAGVDRARVRQAAADLVLVVLDRSEPLLDTDREILASYPDALVVANKADRPPAWEPTSLSISAERGDGLEALTHEIAQRLVPNPPKPGEAVPFRLRHIRSL